MGLPPVRRNPCGDCPWRVNSLPGWLGPHSADEWLAMAHGEGPIACHTTIVGDENGDGDWDHPDILQCAGAARFRANVCKSPRDPDIARGPADRENIFTWNDKFLAHHQA